MLRYSVLRLLIFFGVLGLLWLLGLRDPEERIILVVGAAVLSMVISFFVLRRFREDYSREIAQKLERRAAEKQRKRAAAASDEAAEDHEARRGEEYR
jgi:hypothetical protein